MNGEYIHTLLNKYWGCQTSPSEEKELQDFFLGENVPNDLKCYIPLFRYRDEQQSLSLSPGFEEKIRKQIKKSPQYITIRIFAPLLRIAASVALIVALGISLFLISKQDASKPYLTETYNDSEAAMHQAAFAFEKLSRAFEISESVYIKTFQEIDKLNLDWPGMDSINIEKPAPRKKIDL
ncbi:MAG TPA: hypothetical protein DDZ96_07780 [Porphyromonadaceae bacterium]|jgi:hypothetical protein|nr:hypothetical protein [Porphyromonadaceae bacterium]HBL33703.1 hypothetical protein [Porphyromonadaceae bacterium]HBX18984.1 hypothetical protein [Porphyromonadaceae bacterium]HCM20295.1 hypothetical protein [Porphyromonadaceae bacterium]